MAKKRSNFISLYPLSPDDALRAALQTPPEKKRTIRAAMRIPQARVEVFKEEVGGKAKAKSRKPGGQ